MTRRIQLDTKRDLIVSVAVCLGVRLGALAALTMNQVTHSTSNDSKVIVFTAKIGSRRGGTKNQVGGRKMVGKPPTQILIWDFQFREVP